MKRYPFSITDSFCFADHFNDSYKLRGGVYFVDSLPSTPSGKVIRRLAKSIAEKEFGARKRPM